MLKKGITFYGVFSIAAGAMISSGIFILPGLAFEIAGPAVFLSYFVAGVLALLGIFSLIELATAMPKAGGDFFFVNKTFGPLLGTLAGIFGWIALALKSAFAIFGLTEIVSLYIEINYIISGFIFCAVFVSINIIGIREAVNFQISLVTVLFLLMLTFIGFGLPEVEADRFTPFFREGINNVLITSGFVFITFGGLIKVANVSEEVQNPGKNIPVGIISSVIAVTILYTLVTFVVTGILPAGDFSGSLTPVADAAELFMGSAGYIIVTVASVLAFVSTANAGIMAAARYPMALSRERLLPEKVAKVNHKFRTPVIAILITGAIIFIALMLPLETLVEAASTVILTAFVLTNLAVIVLRESRLINYKPIFKAPFYPYVQIFSILLFIFFIFELGVQAIEITLSLLLAGVIIYLIYGRRKRKKDYALLHLIERYTDKEVAGNMLEGELREILIDRKHIEQDYFDQLIKEARIIDLEKPVSSHDAIERAVNELAVDIHLDEEELLSRFLKGQKEHEICISDFSAILHVFIKGENKMFLTMIRNRSGIKFSDKKDNVKAFFLLGGTREKRMLHLRVLAYLVHLSNKKEFKDKWLKIENTVELKNSIILYQRERPVS